MPRLITAACRAEIADAAAASVIAGGLAGRYRAVERLVDHWIIELAGLAEIGHQVVGADVDTSTPGTLASSSMLSRPRLVSTMTQTTVEPLIAGIDSASGQLSPLNCGNTAPTERRPIGGNLHSSTQRLASRRRVDIGENDAGDAVVEQHRHVGVVGRAHADHRRDADREGRAGDVDDGLDVEDGVLAVDEQEVVVGRLGDANHIGRAHEAHREAHGSLACAHGLEHGVGEFNVARWPWGCSSIGRTLDDRHDWNLNQYGTEKAASESPLQSGQPCRSRGPGS